MKKLHKIGLASVMAASIAASPGAMAEAGRQATNRTTATPKSSSVAAPIISRQLYVKRLEFLASVLGTDAAALERQIKQSV